MGSDEGRGIDGGVVGVGSDGDKKWWRMRGGHISAPPIPVGFRSFRRNLVESSGVEFGRKAC